MRKARAEFKQKSEQTIGVRSATVVDHPATRAYRLDGTPANANTQGIVIEDGKKVVRK